MCDVFRRPEWRLLSLLAIVPALLAGCLIIPTGNVPAAGSRTNIDRETAATLRPGLTTMAEVVLQLGEPDYIANNGQTLGYTSTRVRAVIVSLLPPPAFLAGAEITHTSVLEVLFDERQVVSQVRSREEPPKGDPLPPRQPFADIPVPPEWRYTPSRFYPPGPSLIIETRESVVARLVYWRTEGTAEATLKQARQLLTGAGWVEGRSKRIEDSLGGFPGVQTDFAMGADVCRLTVVDYPHAAYVDYVVARHKGAR